MALACDPPATGSDGDDRPRGAEEQTTQVAWTEASLRSARIVVRRDGTVEIYDRHGELRAQLFDPQARFQATLEPVVGIREWARPQPQVSVRLAGLSDWLTRSAREHRARTGIEARVFAESQRVMIAIAESAETVERGLASLESELAVLWADTSKAAAERRVLLFERWDECEEGARAQTVVRVERAAEVPDAIRAQAGERAREAIERFVRTRLPAGSRDGYGREELERLNDRRRSRRAFAPYQADRAEAETSG